MFKNLFSLLTITALTIGFSSCTQAPEQATEIPGKFKVGLVFDIGGRGDKSFNDSAYAGLERAKRELGIDYEYLETPQATDRATQLHQLASKPEIKLIFGIGFLFTDDINAVAKEFPDKKFACVDYTVDPKKEILANVVALKFKEEEGSFLVGALAGLLTQTNKVGFVGGMKIPLIEKFETGYKAGVKAVNPKCVIFANYAGLTGNAFKDPTKGKELALAMYDKGADIIYHASGSTGLGVFEAAFRKKKYAIGVDADQFQSAPKEMQDAQTILTSMVKRVDESVFQTIKSVKDDRFQTGVRMFDLNSKGIDYVYDANNKQLIPDSVYQKIEELRTKIINGEIIVPTNLQELAK
ncbi:MAG: BMP family ABC transporter substrate-binding protein [bacterium]|nr:BMP family ABC transporter substrate-binding protein [bacterium]